MNNNETRIIPEFEQDISEDAWKEIAVSMFLQAQERGISIVYELSREIQLWKEKAEKLKEKLKQFISLLRFPLWVSKDWELQLSIASSDKDSFVFCFSGEGGYFGELQSEVSLEREEGGLGSGFLRIKWQANWVPPNGWWLAIYRCREEIPTTSIMLGEVMQGEIVLDSTTLKLDPIKEPFCYLIYPDG